MRYVTKRIGIVGFCLATVLAAGMVLAGSASAAPLWLVCLEGAGLTKYENSHCAKASGTGKWQSLGLKSGQTATVKLALEATLILKDTKTAAGESEVECGSSKGEGIIESGGKGKVTVLEVEKPKENCKGIKVCKEKEVEEVKGVHLPWNVEIFETEESPLTKIANSGSGEPGWTVKCNTIGGPQTDTCESENAEHPGEMELSNELASELLVLGNILWPSSAKCSQGGKESGQIEDLVSVSLAGGALSIQPPSRTPPWFEIGPRTRPLKVPIEPAPALGRVIIKNRSLTTTLTVELNDTKELPFVKANSTCGATLAPLAHCFDFLAAEEGTALGTKGTLLITMKPTGMASEKKSFTLEAR